MPLWDEEAGADTTYLKDTMFCVVCEKFFELSAIASVRCPHCWGDARFIVGPLQYRLNKFGDKVIVSDLHRLILENKRKYSHAQRK